MATIIDLRGIKDLSPTVLWEGGELKVAPLTVEQMMQLTHDFEKAREEGGEKIYQELLRQARALLPDAPEEFWKSLPFTGLSILINAVVQDMMSMDPSLIVKKTENTNM